MGASHRDAEEAEGRHSGVRLAERQDPDPRFEPDMERRRLLAEAIRLHRDALKEPDGIRRDRLLQEALRLHSRWTESQDGPVARAVAAPPAQW